MVLLDHLVWKRFPLEQHWNLSMIWFRILIYIVFFWTSSHEVKHLKIKGWHGHCSHSTYSLASAIIALDLQAYVSFNNDRICSMNMFFCLVCMQYFAPKTSQSPLETECQDQQQASQQCNATASRHGFWKLAPGGLYSTGPFLGRVLIGLKFAPIRWGCFPGKSAWLFGLCWDMFSPKTGGVHSNSCEYFVTGPMWRRTW